jgi:hypothetical protein
LTSLADVKSAGCCTARPNSADLDEHDKVMLQTVAFRVNLKSEAGEDIVGLMSNFYNRSVAYVFGNHQSSHF